MPRCLECGKNIATPYVCKYCGGEFCYEHRGRKAHNCAVTPETPSEIEEEEEFKPEWVLYDLGLYHPSELK